MEKISIENAKIIACDFKGEGSRFIRRGIKWALVAIDETAANNLMKVGINIKPNMSLIGDRFLMRCYVADKDFRHACGITNIANEPNLIPRIIGYDSGAEEISVEELADRIDESSGQCDIIMRTYTEYYGDVKHVFSIIDTLYIDLRDLKKIDS